MSREEYATELKPHHLRDLLGVEIYSKDRYEGNNFAGVVTGLAWTAVGGEILFIESSLAKAQGREINPHWKSWRCNERVGSDCITICKISCLSIRH